LIVYFHTGKQVTAAFDFLNNYLSDDEGTEHFESRNQSPIPFAWCKCC